MCVTVESGRDADLDEHGDVRHKWEGRPPRKAIVQFTIRIKEECSFEVIDSSFAI